MELHQIWEIYFSPTGGTKTAAATVAQALSEALDLPVTELDITLPEAREKEYRFGAHDLVVFASPVYAGRLPNKIMPDYKRMFQAEGAACVPVVVFGNRSYGGALLELQRILSENGFIVAAACAVAARHAFTDKLAYGRPDEEDQKKIRAFVLTVAQKLSDPSGFDPLDFGTQEIPPYYTPLKEDGTPANFLKAKPATDPDKCDRCGSCREVCPVGSIDENMDTAGICIKCQACVRKCPKKAKYFDNEDFLSHVRMLEKNYTKRAGNEFFL